MTKARDLASGQNGVRPFATATASFSTPILASGSSTTLTITHPVGRFTAAPIYTAVSGEARVTIGVTGTPSASSVTLVLFNSTAVASSATTGQIVAVQMTSSSGVG